MRPKPAAEQLGIAPNTLRLWCTVYGDYLSSSGAPAAGQHRDLTDDDLKVLYAVKRAKDAGQPIEAIKRMLEDAQADGYQRLPYPPQHLAGTVALVPRAAVDEQMRSLARELEDARQREIELRALVDAKDARIIELERATASAQTELELWRAGRLKPTDE